MTDNKKLNEQHHALSKKLEEEISRLRDELLASEKKEHNLRQERRKGAQLAMDRAEKDYRQRQSQLIEQTRLIEKNVRLAAEKDIEVKLLKEPKQRTTLSERDLTKQFLQQKTKLNQKEIDSDHEFDIFYDLLDKFQRENGHCSVPFRYKTDDLELGKYIFRIKGRYKRAKILFDIYGQKFFQTLPRGTKEYLSLEQLDKLTKIGFDDDIDREWETGYKYLQLFSQNYGHAVVQSNTQVNKKGLVAKTNDDFSFHLGAWVIKQRANYKIYLTEHENYDRQKISFSQVRKLNRLDFLWFTDISSLLEDPSIKHKDTWLNLKEIVDREVADKGWFKSDFTGKDLSDEGNNSRIMTSTGRALRANSLLRRDNNSIKIFKEIVATRGLIERWQNELNIVEAKLAILLPLCKSITESEPRNKCNDQVNVLEAEEKIYERKLRDLKSRMRELHDMRSIERKKKQGI